MGATKFVICWLLFAFLLANLVQAELEVTTDKELKEISSLRCNSAKSRASRQSLEENVFPVLEAEGYELTERCVWHPAHDALKEMEVNKKQTRRAWKCLICKRSFAAEEFLDLHLKNKHPEVTKETDVCLADYCDILGCEDYLDPPPIIEDENVVLPSPSPPPPCTPASIEKRKFECNDLMHKCFPPNEGPVAHRLNLQFRKLFCDSLSCDRPDEPNKRQMTKWAIASKILWWLLFVVVALGLLAYYLIFWLIQGQHGAQKDFKRLSRRPLVQRLFGKKKKEF
jgi:hypothetical protein